MKLTLRKWPFNFPTYNGFNERNSKIKELYSETTVEDHYLKKKLKKSKKQ